MKKFWSLNWTSSKHIDLAAFSQHMQNNPYTKYIFDNVPSQIFWKDKDGIYQGCNLHFAQAADFLSPIEIVGKTDADMPWHKHEFADEYRKEDKYVLTTLKPIVNKEVMLTNSKNEISYILVNKVPLLNEQQQPFGVLGIYNDITDRKIMENRWLLEKQRAERNSEAKSEFIANMGHDLRNSFNGIIGLTDILIHDSSDEEQHEILVAIQTSTKKITNIMNDILQAVCTESGTIPLCIEPSNLRELINDVVAISKPQALHKKIILEAHINDNVPQLVNFDHFRVHQILINLISNAIKFTTEGRVDIFVLLTEDEHSKSWLAIQVEDTGIGIPDNFKERVFEKFARATPANQNIYSGLGLGLSSAKIYADEMQATLSFSSKVGEGTTFTLSLPIDT